MERFGCVLPVTKMPRRRNSRTSGSKIPLREIQQALMFGAPPEGLAFTPSFMEKKAREYKPKQRKDETVFLRSLLKTCADYYRHKLKPIWLARNSNGVALSLDGSRRIHFGLGVGVGDGIGYYSYTIKPEDVGKKIARFLNIEAKAPTGRATDAQQAFHEQVIRDGGISLIVYSDDGVNDVIDKIEKG